MITFINNIKVESAYKCCKIKRRTETIIINQQYYVKKDDDVYFFCSNCNKLHKQKFRFKFKFLDDVLCTSCNKSLNNPYKREDVKEKIKQIKLKKYNNPQFTNREKAKQTMKERYGVEYALQNYNFKNKLRQTNLKKYGAEHALQSEKLKNKKKRNFYNELINSDRLQNKVEPLFTLNEYKNDVLYKKYKWECKQCHTVFKHHIENGCIPRCPRCFPRKAIVSKEEKELYNVLNNYNIKIIQNNRNLIPPYELDFYIPNHNLAIEFNGIYWHSIEVLTDKYYHQNKVELCYNKGIRLLHIWEDEWLDKPEKVKEKILYYIQNLDEEIRPREPILEERKGYKIWT